MTHQVSARVHAQEIREATARVARVGRWLNLARSRDEYHRACHEYRYAQHWLCSLNLQFLGESYAK